jgi:glycosyltransferase involved in cell wall biosynthesis/SAM-dependent methyltransferase
MIIWLASYPRTGNTLLRMMLKSVFERETYSKYDDPFDIGADPATAQLVGHRNLPEKWSDAYAHMRDSEELFLVKTHEPPEDDGRAVYITRDGRAACVSYYNYIKTYMPGSEAVEMGDVIAGFVRYGSWSRHLDAWRPLERPRTLVLRFEELLKDPQPAIARLAEFCGIEPKHEWVNDFAAAQKVNPRFFRQGSAEKSRSEIQGDDLSLFWLLHSDWMEKLGYEPSPPRPAAEAGAILRARIDRREQEIIELREKLNYVQHWADERSGELESRTRTMQEEHRRLEAAEAQVAELQAQVAQQQEQLSAAKCELERATRRAAEAEQSAREARAGEAIAHARLREVELQVVQAQQAMSQRQRELEAAQSQLQAVSTDRDIWKSNAQRWEEQLRRIENMTWLQRIVDLCLRLGRNIYLGWPFAHRPAGPLPRITIVTPVYNGEAHLRACIESVLSQEYPDLEYIIVDGGSTDRSADIAREYVGRGVTRVISEKDNGMYDAIAKGFEYATGDILGYLNADDLYEPGGLKRVGEYFRAHPHVKVVYHEDTVTMDGWRFPNNPQPPHIDRTMLLAGHILFQDGVFFRRHAYVESGGLNRHMRRAGDWDLWVRMLSKFRFRRNDGHISSFRVRSGQLSADLAAYYAELEHQRAAWQQSIGPWGRLLAKPAHYWGMIKNILLPKLRPREFFYPLDKSGCVYGFKPPPRTAPPENAPPPRCPLTGRIPERLLFSSPDARFGDPLVNYVYYCEASDLAIVWPPLSKEQLNVLYEKYYSKPATEITPPPDGFASPYKDYFGGSLIDRLARRIQLPGRLKEKVRWDDKTIDELLENLPKVPRHGGKIEFFDVGCFEGSLLDQIKQRTDWITCGLEPNANAAAVAQAKGHRVWQGFAEDAVYVVPEGVQFDVIYLGQTIEHLLDPLTVVRRLRTLLKPGGRLVVSTPNLRARQIKQFGPTWAHWHVPYHRHIFSDKSMRLLARLSEFDIERLRHYSHPYWTCISVALNRLGLAAAVPHAVPFGHDIVQPALNLTAWSKYLWDWRGQGDYIFAVLRREE